MVVGLYGNIGNPLSGVNMKATLEFDIPEEHENLKIALAAPKLISCLHYIRENIIRDRLKYGDPSEDEIKILEQIRTHIYEEVGDVIE